MRYIEICLFQLSYIGTEMAVGSQIIVEQNDMLLKHLTTGTTWSAPPFSNSHKPLGRFLGDKVEVWESITHSQSYWGKDVYQWSDLVEFWPHSIPGIMGISIIKCSTKLSHTKCISFLYCFYGSVLIDIALVFHMCYSICYQKVMFQLVLDRKAC